MNIVMATIFSSAMLLSSDVGEKKHDTCDKTAEADFSKQDVAVPDWATINGKWEHFLHPETQFMLLCVIFSCLICWNWVGIYCFITGTKRQPRDGLSDFEATKIAISESAAGICVFSLFMTTVAPVVRQMRKKWFTISPFFSINESLGMHFHEHSIAKNAGPDYDLNPRQDLSWIGHAVLGLLWVFLGYAAIRSGASKSSKMHKECIGKLAMVSLLCHFIFSCSNVLVDGANHTWMNKICLLSAWPSIFLNITIAIAALFERERLSREQRITMHMRHMFLGWIQSIEGSGQIRIIGTLNYISGNLVTHYCKNHLYSFGGSECAWKYLERGFFATCVSSVYLCLYSWRNPVDKEMRKLVKNTVPNVVIEYAILKFAEHLDAQYILSAYQLLKSAQRVSQIVSIIRFGLAFPIVPAKEGVTEEILFKQPVEKEVPEVLAEVPLEEEVNEAKVFSMLPKMQAKNSKRFEEPLEYVSPALIFYSEEASTPTLFGG